MNYSRIMDAELSKIASSGEKPRLLLHVCCAPCGSSVLEYLTRFFIVTVLYYNPNIYPQAEYDKRLAELRRLIADADFCGGVGILECDYSCEDYDAAAESLSGEPEGGKRCEICFRLRLMETAKLAKNGGYDYFTTTLSVSPHKNAALLNEIGGELAEAYGVRYLFSDFKKRDGYKRSIELSDLYGLYRQKYCGCKYTYFSFEKEK